MEYWAFPGVFYAPKDNELRLLWLGGLGPDQFRGLVDNFILLSLLPKLTKYNYIHVTAVLFVISVTSSY